MTSDEPSTLSLRPLAPVVALGLLGQLVACHGDSAPAAASSAASSAAPASASASAPAPAASSAGPRPAITHEPGTVPVRATSRPAAVAPPDAGAVTPALSRVAAARTRKAGAEAREVTFVDRGLVLVTTAKGVDLVFPPTGVGISITQGSPTATAFATDGPLLAVGEDGRTVLWDLGKWSVRHTWPDGGLNLAFSADGKRLAIGGEKGFVVRDTTSGRELSRVQTDAQPFGLAFGAGGKEVLETENNVSVAVYAADSGAKLGGGGGAETTATFGLALSPDGRFAAAGSPAGHGLQVFDVHAWGPRTLVVVPEGACREHVAPWFSPDGHRVFASGGQRWVKGFEAGSWKPYASYHAPPGRDIAGTAADLARVVIVKEGGKGAAVVNVSTGTETPLERPFEDIGYSFSTDGLHVAGVSSGALRVWSGKTGRVEYEQQP